MSYPKVILHLCADTGSDSYPYSQDPDYEVVLVGEAIGVENFSLAAWLHYHGLDKKIYGVIANPVCLEFSTARRGGKARDPYRGMGMVRHCMRIIEEAESLGGLKFWVIENPAKGRLKDFMEAPRYQYEPWWFGSPWTKKTALWGGVQYSKACLLQLGRCAKARWSIHTPRQTKAISCVYA